MHLYEKSERERKHPCLRQMRSVWILMDAEMFEHHLFMRPFGLMQARMLTLPFILIAIEDNFKNVIKFSGMPRKKKQTRVESNEDFGGIIIKRYGNRRLYNTETKNYVNYADLARIVRDGNDIKVIDSTNREDVTKAVLIQVVLEEEKNNKTVLPTEFLFQLLRSREDSMQDFFKNHLSTSFNAYLKTKEEFDNRFRTMLELASAAPQMWEKLIPGAEVVREVLTGKKKEKKNKTDE